MHVAKLAVVATEVRPPRAASPVGVPEAGAERPAAPRPRAMLARSVAEHAMKAVRRVELEQVLVGQGSQATRERRERRIRGGNRRVAERRRVHGQAMPAAVAVAASAAAAPMLCEDGDGYGGAAPWKWPRQGGSEALGQRCRAAVATPAGPPPRALANAQSSATTAPTSCSVWALGGGGYAADGGPQWRTSVTGTRMQD